MRGHMKARLGIATALTFSGCVALAGCFGLPGAALAQSTRWDSIISNTSYYVPTPMMLAYAATTTSLANPLAIGDQTLWSLGTSTNGIFTGTSTGELAIGPTVALSSQTIQGTVTTDGRITMVFTSPDGTTTIGVGSMANRAGLYEMEMQMITGDGVLVSHWAYMTPYDPASFTPPAPQMVPSNASPQWAWVAGTPWRILRTGAPSGAPMGNLLITNYQGGYFWGVAADPSGGRYSVLGSITPEGRVLLNTLQNGNLVNLYGAVEGDASAAAMLLGLYDASGIYTGEITTLTLVQPYSETTQAYGNTAAYQAANVLYGIASSVDGVFGPMAPVIQSLNGLEGASLSTAISQTLPVLSGAGVQATYATQQAFQQVVTGRLDEAYAPRAGAPRNNLWIQPFGGYASQGTEDGVTGYTASGGGLAVGIDAAVGANTVLGLTGAYSYTEIDGSADSVPNTLDVSSYRFGLYGLHALTPNVRADFLLDAGYLRNSENRSITFMGSSASADYDGWIGHAHVGLSRAFDVAPSVSLTPKVGLDYSQVAALGYTETGAGVLDLTADYQTYQNLTLGIGLAGSYALTDRVRLNADVGVGYNALDNQTQLTASYAGGGPAFVTYGPDLSPWTYSAGASLVAAQSETMSFSVAYDVEASPSGFVGQSGSLRFKMKF